MKTRTIITVAAFILVLAGALITYNILGQDAGREAYINNDKGEAQKTEQAQAPNFTVYDEAGKKVSFEELKGKPIVMNFWVSWCRPCQSEMGTFDEVSKQLEGDVNFVMINVTDGERETEETAKTFIKETGYSFPVYFDKKLDAATAFGVYSYPTTYFIDAKGNLVAGANGVLDEETLMKGIEMIREADQGIK